MAVFEKVQEIIVEELVFHVFKKLLKKNLVKNQKKLKWTQLLKTLMQTHLMFSK